MPPGMKKVENDAIVASAKFYPTSQLGLDNEFRKMNGS